MAVRRGEVWLADLGEPPQGHEQAGRRPVVVLQVDDLSWLSTTIIVPLTGQFQRAGSATAVVLAEGIAGLQRDSVALCHQIRALDPRRLVHRIGTLPPDKVSEIEAAIAFILGLPI